MMYHYTDLYYDLEEIFIAWNLLSTVRHILGAVPEYEKAAHLVFF